MERRQPEPVTRTTRFRSIVGAVLGAVRFVRGGAVADRCPVWLPDLDESRAATAVVVTLVSKPRAGRAHDHGSARPATRTPSSDIQELHWRCDCRTGRRTSRRRASRAHAGSLAHLSPYGRRDWNLLCFTVMPCSDSRNYDRPNSLAPNRRPPCSLQSCCGIRSPIRFRYRDHCDLYAQTVRDVGIQRSAVLTGKPSGMGGCL